MSQLAEQFASVQDSIASAIQRSGRQPGDVSLVAVSKLQPPDAIWDLFAAGQRIFGESRVQEAVAKIADAPAATRWQFIGHLQANKVRQALPLFELIHSIDSLDLARNVDRIAGDLGLRPSVLLEVNVAGEASKYGFSPVQLHESLESLLALPRLEISGLMTIPPHAADPEYSRPYFAQLRELRDELEKEFSVKFPSLSMGMSGDFVVAIEEGATLVRVGSALFGARQRR